MKTLQSYIIKLQRILKTKIFNPSQIRKYSLIENTIFLFLKILSEIKRTNKHIMIIPPKIRLDMIFQMLLISNIKHKLY